jgi:hypothetical protein
MPSQGRRMADTYKAVKNINERTLQTDDGLNNLISKYVSSKPMITQARYQSVARPKKLGSLDLSQSKITPMKLQSRGGRASVVEYGQSETDVYTNDRFVKSKLATIDD